MKKKFLEPEIEILNFLCFVEDNGPDSGWTADKDEGDDLP